MDSQSKGGASATRAVTRVAKSPNAFRTISEVSAELEVAQHVLRFWESKFKQIKPMKRAGGRRFYRPEDVELLRRIKSLLRDERYTIEGVQRLLDQGLVEEPTDQQAPTATNDDLPLLTPAARGKLTPQQKEGLSAALNELRAIRAELETLG